MKKRMWVRKLHYWSVPIVALPFLIVIVSGLFLQVKKQVHWVQPPTQVGSIETGFKGPWVTWDQILKNLQSDHRIEVRSWKDIRRLDVRPSKGIAKIQLVENVEVQMDLANARILQVATRNSDWIEALHDGSWFNDWAKLWIFLPSGIIVLVLWFTGVILFVLPFYLKRMSKYRV